MVVSLVSPYLQQEPVNMGGKIGFIWGGVSAITLAWVFWFVPELKVCNGVLKQFEPGRLLTYDVAILNLSQGRTLEQIDYMYDRGVPARKMSTYVMAYPVDDKMAEKGEFAHEDDFHARA
jgi:hypothetical protein